MDILTIIGFFSAGIIGVSLGLIGGGGSILTVPVMIYFMGQDAKTATAYSLFIVGISALVGAFRYMQQQLVDYRTAVIFALPALTAVYLTRAFLVPLIPEELFRIGDLIITGDMGIMVFFALIMLLAAYSMIRGRKEEKEEEESTPAYNYPKILAEGFGVGIATGIVGAGGGFLIIPALVILAKLPMKKAVGTSLLIISVKSLIGFLGDLSNPQIGQGAGIDWSFLLLFSMIAMAGILLGTWLGHYIPGKKLKKGFGYFVLIMGIYIMTERVSLLFKESTVATEQNIAH